MAHVTGPDSVRSRWMTRQPSRLWQSLSLKLRCLGLQFWAHSNCCQLGTESCSLCSSWTDTAAGFWAKKAWFSVMAEPQDCFKHVLTRRQYSDSTCVTATYAMFWRQDFGLSGGMVVTTNMDLMETQFSHHLGTRMISQDAVWKRTAWYFKAKRVLRRVFISFIWGHTKLVILTMVNKSIWEASGRVDLSIDRAMDLACGPQLREKSWLNVSFLWIKFVYDKYGLYTSDIYI